MATEQTSSEGVAAMGHGSIVLLSGPPRSGKTSIANAIQDDFDGVWMNLGLDHFKRMTPRRYQPGIGLRPGGERPDLEPLVVVLYQAMYAAIADYSRRGLNVVADVTHHDAYSRPLGILASCARQLRGLPVLFIGVRCPLDVVRERRRATWGRPGYTSSSATTDPVELWQRACNAAEPYDLAIEPVPERAHAVAGQPLTRWP